MRPKISVITIIVIVFQSTHPCGVRRKQQLLRQLLYDFNPRTHVGCDLVFHQQWLLVCYFNPRTHVGCDICRRSGLSPKFGFQSTHPCGVRHSFQKLIHISLLFQSTHPCGVRQCHLTLFCKNKVSIDIEYITNSLYFHCFS